MDRFSFHTKYENANHIPNVYLLFSGFFSPSTKSKNTLNKEEVNIKVIFIYYNTNSALCVQSLQQQTWFCRTKNCSKTKKKKNGFCVCPKNVARFCLVEKHKLKCQSMRDAKQSWFLFYFIVFGIYFFFGLGYDALIWLHNTMSYYNSCAPDFSWCGTLIKVTQPKDYCRNLHLLHSNYHD